MNIALVGSAPSSVRLAPYGSPDWKIWACSPGVYGIAPRTDAWFEIHRWEPGQPWFSPEYCQFLRNYRGPVYMAQSVTEIPNSVAIEKDYLESKYGPYFFTSSLAYMFAMAIDAIEEEWAEQDRNGVERSQSKIALYGVDMAATEEYMWQKPGCVFFALIARAKGIEVGVPPESDLLRPPPMYGVSELDHMRIKILARKRELQGRIADAQARAESASKEVTFLQGALDDLNWVDVTWTGDDRAYVEPPLVPALQ